MELSATVSAALSRSNSTSDDSSSDDPVHKPSCTCNTKTTTVSQNDDPSFKEEKKIKKKKKKKNAAAELHLLCSWGGEIEPDRHGNIIYSGGEHHVVAVERHCSLSHLFVRIYDIFKIPEHRRFRSLKYKLPNHGLDPLITIATDQELQFMINMYDHANRRGHEFCNLLNLRLFLI